MLEVVPRPQLIFYCFTPCAGLSISNQKLKVQVLLITGGKDWFLKFPRIEEYVTSGVVQEYASDLEIKFFADGTHLIQVREQIPGQVNEPSSSVSSIRWLVKN